MTQNLRIQNYNLNSNDSDMPSGSFYLAASSNVISNGMNSVHIDSTFGGYYNWYTATIQNNIQNATQSICPKGWKIPPVSNYSKIQSLYDKDSIRQSPANFDLNGQYNGGSTFINKNINGYYYTSEPSSGNSQMFCFGNSTPLTISGSCSCGGGCGWSVGFAVRCII